MAGPEITPPHSIPHLGIESFATKNGHNGAWGLSWVLYLCEHELLRAAPLLCFLTRHMRKPRRTITFYRDTYVRNRCFCLYRGGAGQVWGDYIKAHNSSFILVPGISSVWDRIHSVLPCVSSQSFGK